MKARSLDAAVAARYWHLDPRHQGYPQKSGQSLGGTAFPVYPQRRKPNTQALTRTPSLRIAFTGAVGPLRVLVRLAQTLSHRQRCSAGSHGGCSHTLVPPCSFPQTGGALRACV